MSSLPIKLRHFIENITHSLYFWVHLKVKYEYQSGNVTTPWTCSKIINIWCTCIFSNSLNARNLKTVNESTWYFLYILAIKQGELSGLVWSGFSKYRIYPVKTGTGKNNRIHPVKTGTGKKDRQSLINDPALYLIKRIIQCRYRIEIFLKRQ